MPEQKRIRVLLLFLLCITALSVMVYAEGGNTGTFPSNDKWNGVQIFYSITGGTLGQADDDMSGFTISRQHDGKLGKGNLHISGHINTGLLPSSTIQISVSAGSLSETKTIDVKDSKKEEAFSLSVPIPADAEQGSYAIRYTGHSPYGNRGVLVKGTLSNKNYVTPEKTEVPVVEKGDLLPIGKKMPPKPSPIEGLEDAGVRFSDIKGMVGIYRAHKGYELEPAELDSILYVDDQIKTEEDSYAILSFSDMTTFSMRPETIINLDSPPGPDSKISLIFGNIYRNVKMMLETGTMETTMNQAVTGERG